MANFRTFRVLTAAALFLSMPGPRAWAAIAEAPAAASASGEAGLSAASAGALRVGAVAPVALTSFAAPFALAPALSAPSAPAAAPAFAAAAAAAAPAAAPVAAVAAPNAVPPSPAAVSAPHADVFPIAVDAVASAAPASAALPTAPSLPRRFANAIGRRLGLPRGAPEAAEADQLFDGANFEPGTLRVHLAGNGRAPRSVPLEQLSAALAADPDFRDALARSGRVRLIVRRSAPSEAAEKAAVPGLTNYLKSLGVARGVDVETIAPPKPAAVAPSAEEAAAATPAGGLLSALASPVRESRFLGRQFSASMSWPNRSEVVGGLFTRVPFIALNVLAFAPLYLPAHPLAFVAIAGLTLALKTFYSFWVDAWAAFQNRLARLRGVPYLAAFNLVYGQLIAALYRAISWTALPNVVPPWALSYWRDMGIVTFVGTFIGTLASQGLNELYEKGVLTRRGRSALIQGRSLLMDGTGYFFKTGLMGSFWPIFAAQQVLDLLLYVVSVRAEPRAVLYIAAADVSASPEFAALYPVTAAPVARASGLARARQALLENPLSRALAKLWSWARRRGPPLADQYDRALSGASLTNPSVLSALPTVTPRLDAAGAPVPATREGGISVPVLVDLADGRRGVFKPIRMAPSDPLFPYERMKLLREIVGSHLMRAFGVETLDYRLARATLDGREVLGIASPFTALHQPVAGSPEEDRLVASESFARGSVVDAWLGNTDRILNRGNLWASDEGSAVLFGDFDQGFRDGVEVLGVPKLPLVYHSGAASTAAVEKTRAQIAALSDRAIAQLVDGALAQTSGYGVESREYLVAILCRNRDALRRSDALAPRAAPHLRLNAAQAAALADAAQAGDASLRDVVYLWNHPELEAPTRALLDRLVADRRAGRSGAVELPPEQLELLPVLMNLVYVRLSARRAIESGLGYYP